MLLQRSIRNNHRIIRYNHQIKSFENSNKISCKYKKQTNKFNYINILSLF